MTLPRRSGDRRAALTLPAMPRSSRAQAAAIKIGVLNDLSGPYANTGGVTSVICAEAGGRGIRQRARPERPH